MERRTDLDVFRNDEFLKLIKGNVQGPIWRVFTRFIIRNMTTDSIESIVVPSEELSASTRTNNSNDSQVLDNQESTAEAEINDCSENEPIQAERVNNEKEVNYEEEVGEKDRSNNLNIPKAFKNIVSNILYIEYDNLYDEINENGCCQNAVVTIEYDSKTPISYNLNGNTSYNDKKDIKDSITDNTEENAHISALLPSTCNNKQIKKNKFVKSLEKATNIYVKEHESEADFKLLKILRTIELDDVDTNENRMLLKNYNAKYSRETHSKPFVRKPEKKELTMNKINKNIKNIKEKQTEMANNVESLDYAKVETDNVDIKANEIRKNNPEKDHESILTNTEIIGNKSKIENLEKTSNITNTNSGDYAQSNVIQINEDRENDPAINVGCFCGYFNLFSWFY